MQHTDRGGGDVHEPDGICASIQDRLIDYMRMHIADAGGVTPCRKAAAMGELLGVKTAWHGSGD